MVLAQRVTLPWSSYVFDSSSVNRATIKAWLRDRAPSDLQARACRFDEGATRGNEKRDKAVETAEERERERERGNGHHVLFMLNVVSALSAGYSLCPLAYFILRFSA